jgi:hypothetical protein
MDKLNNTTGEHSGESHCSTISTEEPLSTGKTRNHARALLGEVLRHEQGLGSHGCVEVANAIRVIDTLIGDRECLAVENSRLRGLLQRARAMIDVSPEDSPDKWPSTNEINQLVRDCDDILSNVQDHESPEHGGDSK